MHISPNASVLRAQVADFWGALGVLEIHRSLEKNRDQRGRLQYPYHRYCLPTLSSMKCAVPTCTQNCCVDAS
jgi:hypothetical protein